MNSQDVLTFWYEETSAEQKFKKGPAFDQQLRDRFLEIHTSIVAGEKEEWKDTAEGTLAYIIVLDQFSRNMFRNDPKSFAADDQAIAAMFEGIDKGFDKEIPVERRSFFYMPIMHSEDAEVHANAAHYFDAVGEKTAHYEMLHKKIIDRFGRYPHRNEILGRESTPEEIEFLKEENSSF